MIYPYQQKVVDALRQTFKVHQISREHNLPVQPRTHTLIVGPTGAGKTHLTRQMAKELNWGCLTLNASGWIVQGARQESTMSTIFNWVSRQPQGRPLVFVLDEVDKANADEEGWWRALKAELYSFLDGHIPPGDYSVASDSDKESDIRKAAELAEVRIKKSLVIACGAFQSIHDAAGKKSMGFLQDNSGPVDCSHDKLSHLLQRELVNRFGQVLQLPSPVGADYEAMFDEVLQHAPQVVVTEARRLLPEFIPEAETNKLGARAVEVLLYRVYAGLADGDDLKPWRPPLTEDELWNEPIPKSDIPDIDMGA